MKEYFKPEITIMDLGCSDIITMSSGGKIYDDELPLVPFDKWSSL